ncbi:hypothetical protein EB077_12025, partial [bacterium]|nr:hypothetical protein [bacterium]
MKKKSKIASKIIPALALLGGAYLLLNSKGTQTSNNTQDTSTNPTPPFNPNTTITTTNTQVQTTTSGSEVSGTDVRVGSDSRPDYKNWRGKEWYDYVNILSSKLDRKNAIKQAFNEWNNPENKYYSFIPNEAAFLLMLAIAERMPYYQKKDFVESGDYSHINTGQDKIGNIPVDRPIRWDSQPIYDTYYGWWYGIEPWSCQDWIDYHKALERKYNSTQRANDIWRTAWFNSQNSGANAALENVWYYCPRDCANFTRYFATKGITDTGGGFTAPIYCNLTGIVQNIVGTVESGTSAIANVSKVLTYALPVAIIAIGYFAY